MTAWIAEVEIGRDQSSLLGGGCCKDRGIVGPYQPFIENGIDIMPRVAQPYSDGAPEILVQLELQTGSTVTSWNLVSSAP